LYAAKCGYKLVSELLLTASHIDINLKDSSRSSSLSWAAEKVYDDIAQQLFYTDMGGAGDFNCSGYLEHLFTIRVLRKWRYCSDDWVRKNSAGIIIECHRFGKNQKPLAQGAQNTKWMQQSGMTWS